MKKAVISIGTNLGNRELYVNKALEMIGSRAGAIRHQSSVYETEAWGFKSENAFLNLVIEIETELEPHALMRELLLIEQEMGRKRDLNPGYSSRQIDLDILFYEELVLNEKDLVIPHPRLHERNFILVPAAEILPAYRHPLLKKNLHQLLLESNDRQKVVKYS